MEALEELLSHFGWTTGFIRGVLLEWGEAKVLACAILADSVHRCRFGNPGRFQRAEVCITHFFIAWSEMLARECAWEWY